MNWPTVDFASTAYIAALAAGHDRHWSGWNWYCCRLVIRNELPLSPAIDSHRWANYPAGNCLSATMTSCRRSTRPATWTMTTKAMDLAIYCAPVCAAIVATNHWMTLSRTTAGMLAYCSVSLNIVWWMVMLRRDCCPNMSALTRNDSRTMCADDSGSSNSCDGNSIYCTVERDRTADASDQFDRCPHNCHGCCSDCWCCSRSVRQSIEMMLYVSVQHLHCFVTMEWCLCSYWHRWWDSQTCLTNEQRIELNTYIHVIWSKMQCQWLTSVCICPRVPVQSVSP